MLLVLSVLCSAFNTDSYNHVLYREFSHTLTINLYIELRVNYIYDFLDEFKDLSNQVVISNIEVDFLTSYNQLTYSYVTHAKFKYKDKIYRVSFDLIEEDGWKTYLQQLIK